MDVWNTVKQAEQFGVELGQATLNWQKVMERKNKIISQFVSGKEPYLRKLGVDYLLGKAVFIDEHTIDVNGQQYTADKFLIGVGSDTYFPDIEGIQYVSTNKELYNLTSLPQTLLIVGGGVIALETAHMFSSAGVEVTMLIRGNRLLSSQDEETSAIIKDISEKRGIRIQTHASIKKIEKHGSTLSSTFEQQRQMKKISSELILMAAGRKPAIQDLGLEKAKVNYTDKGIAVNEFLQTSNPTIYAAGDSIGGIMLTPVAAFEAKIAMRNAFRGNHQKVDYALIPHAIFTLPPVASVGLTEMQAREKGIQYQVNKLPLTHSGTAILLGATEGYIKLISDAKTGRLIGAHLVSAHADEMIHELAIAIKGNLSLQDIAEIPQVHPTLSEAIIELAMQGVKEINQKVF